MMKKRIWIYTLIISVVGLSLYYLNQLSFTKKYERLLKLLKHEKHISVKWKTLDLGFYELKYSRYINALTFSGEFTEEAIDSLNSLQNLESLNFSNSNLSDYIISKLTFSNTVKVLYVSNTEITGESLKNICEKTQLEHLDITGIRICNLDLKPLNNQESLKYLRLSLNCLNEELFKYLDNPNIEQLILDHLPLSKVKKEDFEVFKNLKQLGINFCGISRERFLEIKKHLPKVEVDYYSTKLHAPKEQVKVPKGKKTCLP